MSEFSFSHDEQAQIYFLKVAEAMTKLFNVSFTEAIGRINKACEGQVYEGQKLIYRELPEDAAKNIYYEDAAYWWVEKWMAENTPKPKPYP